MQHALVIALVTLYMQALQQLQLHLIHGGFSW